jgi:plasmid stabilization system protein ParE
MSEANANFTTANSGEFVCGRVKGFEKYLIFYRVFDNYIEIVRVLHSAQDIDSIMEDENIN